MIHKTCRWPIGEASPMQFCDKPSDGPWCAEHRKRALWPTQPKPITYKAMARMSRGSL